MNDTTAAPLAAVDLGSNSFRVEVGALAQGRYQRLDYRKETVRLGAGLDADGMLVEAAVQRGLDCLRRFNALLGGVPAGRVRAVATQTLREARNRDAFLQRAQGALGHPIEVIAGREEARLIYAGVALLQPLTRPRLVIDIGGRSTELILGQGRVPQAAESFPVGSVSLSMRWFGDGAVTADAFAAAQVAAEAEFEESLQTFAREHWREALGSSGTVGAVAAVLQAAGRGATITVEGVRWCIARCVAAGHVDRIELPGLKPERRAVFPGGLSIVLALMTQFGIDELQAARGALRQGVIADLHERLLAAAEAHGDVRDETVRALQQRFGVDEAQADRVRAAALALYDTLPAAQRGEPRRELAWAALLHECGMIVSHHDHHRHSEYLIAHADAPGFSQNQQRRIGTLVLGQRGGLRKIDAALALPGVAWQVLCLRLAVIACHAREDAAGALALRAQGADVRVVMPPDWGQRHPRTHYLLGKECEAWGRATALRLALAE